MWRSVAPSSHIFPPLPSRGTTCCLEQGQFALRSDPSLCLSVEAGCPHAAQGCIVLAACAGPAATVFALKEDPTSPGTHRIVDTASGKCLDIFSHDAFEGAPLEVYACYGLGEDNQRAYSPPRDVPCLPSPPQCCSYPHSVFAFPLLLPRSLKNDALLPLSVAAA